MNIATISPATSETLLTVSQVAKSIPGRTGSRGLAPSTVARWIVSGAPARNGERVRLAAVRVGGRWLVRPADLQTFFAALGDTTPAATIAKPKRRTETQRRRASEAAARELEKRGA